MQTRRWHTVEASYLILLASVALLVLLCAATWTYEARGSPGGATIVLPLGPGRQLHAIIWKPGPDYAQSDLNHAVLISKRGPVNIMLWYQDQGAGRMIRLTSFKLALWPLLVPTATLGLVAVALGMSRHSQRRTRNG